MTSLGIVSLLVTVCFIYLRLVTEPQRVGQGFFKPQKLKGFVLSTVMPKVNSSSQVLKPEPEAVTAYTQFKLKP